MTRTGPFTSGGRGSRLTLRAAGTRSSARSAPASSGWASPPTEPLGPRPAEPLASTEPGMPTVRIGHSPDADDAFMFYALTAGKVKITGVTIEHVLEDIESLNRRARTAELEVTAVSFASYLLIADQYRMLDPGASVGLGYGPIPRAVLESRVVASPGRRTTSSPPLSLRERDPPLIEDAFDKIPQAVLDG